MTSRGRIEADRRISLESTGPKTPELVDYVRESNDVERRAKAAVRSPAAARAVRNGVVSTREQQFHKTKPPNQRRPIHHGSAEAIENMISRG